MSIDLETAAKIASLSRIAMEKPELEAMTNDLNKILAWVEQLNEVNTAATEPLANVNDEALRWREQDIIDDGYRAQEILVNAPSQTAGFFTVPKVVE
ncbi:MAG: Asp-tRNA(Asn)/Glu-tRNA(Gln) amidotransferase subunit GatC [Alphaproteobacteria bacterium]|nr:Asp-tRNA(Asn)/Glu-tRNA(Gln) amidotransferase subunit GatC [Alphaproteobacteria bacterium]